MLGTPGDGFKKAMAALDVTRPIIACGAVGLARKAMESAALYAKKRTAFDRPIADQQAVKFMLADMAIGNEAARLLAWKAADKADRGIVNTKESSMAKAFAADMAMKATTDAVQIYGGQGYTRWHSVEKLMRDAKAIQIYEGTSQIQRIIVARELLKSVKEE